MAQPEGHKSKYHRLLIRMSVWDHVDRARFVKDVADLHKLGRWQHVSRKGNTTSPRSSVNDQLPVQTEMLIADDLAFLAAWRANPGSVAAATAVVIPPRSIRVTVAANEGIPSVVRNGLRKLMACLSACASLGKNQSLSKIPWSETAADVFQRKGNRRVCAKVLSSWWDCIRTGSLIALAVPATK